MASSLSADTFVVDNASASPTILSFNADPTITLLAAPVGSLCLRTDSAGLYVKTGAGSTAWSLLPVVATRPGHVAFFGDGSDGVGTFTHYLRVISSIPI